MSRFVNKFYVATGPFITRIVFSDEHAVGGQVETEASLIMTSEDARSLRDLLNRIIKDEAAPANGNDKPSA